MLIVMTHGCTHDDVDVVVRVLEGLGRSPHTVSVDGRIVVTVPEERETLEAGRFDTLPGVDHVLPVSRVPRLSCRQAHPEPTRIQLGDRTIEEGRLTLIAGPCAVENEDQLIPLALRLKDAGADLLRAGAYKPRTSPYEFQGLEEPGLRLLARARQETGLPVITEAVDEASLELVVEYADVVQIGARNMQNFGLLKRAGRCRRPVFLKRGMSARLEDLLMAAEYLLDEGNAGVMLCERGIRTFADHCRYTLDLSIVPQLKRLTHLPVFVDPSHASGIRESVRPLALAAVAAGADGVMLEVHPNPCQALCDGPQSLLPGQFAELAGDLRAMGAFMARQTVPVP